MPWFRVDDQSTFHAKVLRAGNSAFGAWVRIGCYCNAQLTDGRVGEEVARMIASKKDLDQMCNAGLARKIDDGYEIHDYLEYQPSKREVLSKREKTKTRVKRFRNADGNAVTGSVSNGVGTPPPSTKGTGWDGDPDSSEKPDARAHVDWKRMQDDWLAATGNIAMRDMPEIGAACEEYGRLAELDPNEYARRAFAAFVEWATKGCAPGKRPPLAPNKFLEHIVRIHEMVTGKRKPVESDDRSTGAVSSGKSAAPPPVLVHGDGSTCYSDCDRDGCDSGRVHRLRA